MAKQRKRFSESFKFETIALVIEENYSIRQAADKKGVGKSTLGKWVREYRKKQKSVPECSQENVSSIPQQIYELGKNHKQLEKADKRKKHYFFLNANLGKTLTGIESSAFLRAKLFKRHLNIIPTIITHSYNSELRFNKKHYIESGMFDSDVNVVNLFDFYCDKVDEAQQNNNQSYTQLPNTHKDIADDRVSYRLWKDNQLLMYVKCNERTGLIHFINYMNSSRKTFRRDYYDESGYLSKTGEIDTKTKQTRMEYYFDRQGRQRINIQYNLRDEKHSKIDRILILNEQGIVIKIFYSKEQLVEDFIVSIAQKYQNDELYFIIDRCKIYYPAFESLSHQSNVHVIPVIHSVHVAGDNIMTSRLNKNFKDVLDNLSKSNATPVIFTEKQKSDIASRLGHANKLTVIPHARDNINEMVELKCRDRFLLVAVARLSEEKQIDKMIEMFSLVHKKVPQAKLEIYGAGKLRNDLQDKIDQLSLSKHIKLKGFVADIQKVLQNSGLSLLTSKCESFSLVVLESLSMGCPVISFDINYGPSDMIKHGKNGYLIEPNNLQEMANKVVYLLSNVTLHEEMCRNAYVMAQDFSTQQIAIKWELLLNKKPN